MKPSRLTFSPGFSRLQLVSLSAILLVGFAAFQLPLPAQTVTWDAGTNMTWSQPDSGNWSGDTYNSGDTAQFLGSGAGTITIQPGGVTPGAVIVNSGADYTFTGGAITSAGALTKAGTGTLTLNPSAANAFGGGVNVNGGTLAATVNPGLNALGTSPISIAAGATHQWNHTGTSGNTTIANPTTGDGTLIVNFATGGSARNTSITGLSGFTGTIELTKAGPATTADKWNANVGTLDAALVIGDGTQLFLTGNSTFTGGIQVSGTGNSENRGAIRASGGTLGGDITLLGNTTIGTEGGNLSGNISTGVAGTSTLTLGTGSSGGAITLSGVLSDGTGALALTLTRPTQVVLNNANTYSGGTTLNAGRLLLNGNGTLGTGTVTVNPNAQVFFDRTDTFANDFTIAGNGSSGPDTQPRGALRIEQNAIVSGNVTLAGAASIGSYNNNTGTVSGNISGPHALTINAAQPSSPGRIIFSGTNSYTGGTTVAHGTLQIDSPAALPSTGTHTVNSGATLQLNSGGNNTYSQTLAGTGRVLLNTSGGTSNTFLNGNNTGFTGLLELTGSGGNKLNASGLNLNPAATIRVNPGAQIFLNGATVPNNIEISGTGNTENRGAIRATNGTITGNISLFGNANIGPEGNGTISGNITSGAAGSQTITFGAPSSGGNLNVSGSVADGTGTLAVAVTNGTTTLSGNNSYTGGTTVNQGTLILAGNNTTTGATTVNGGTLRFANAGAMNAATPNPLNATGGTVQMNGTSLAVGEAQILSGAIIENASASPATVTFASASDSVVGGLLRDGAGGGALSVAKDGPGTLTLANTSQTYSGATTINEGTLRLAAPSSTNPVSAGLTWSLDASNATTINAGAPANGDAVSSWTAAAGPSVAQTNAAQQPLFIENALNGLSAIRFDGVDDNLFSPTANAQANTIFVVNNPDGAQTNLSGLVGGNGQGGTVGDKGIRANPGGDNTLWRHPGDGNDFTNPAGSIMRVNGIATNNHGSNPHILAATRNAGAMAFNAVGRYFGGREFAGDVGEILAFDRILTPGEILLVEAYLANKWLGIANTTDLLPTSTPVSIASGATLQLDGITQTIGSLSGASGASVELNNSALTTGTDGTDTTFAGIISGDGSLTKTGTGTQTLSGDNTYTGPTDVQGGTLLVDGDQSAATGDVSVQSAATLGGTGTIGGATVIAAGGTLSPGNSAGTLTFTNNLTLDPGATLFSDVLFGGTGTDLVVVGGNVSLDGAILDGTWGGTSANVFRGTYSADNMFWLIDNQGQGPIDGRFANTTPAPGFAGLFDGVVPDLVTIDGQLFAAFYESQFGNFSQAGLTGGNDLLLMSIPEPSRAMLLALALGSLLLRRRRP